MPARAAKRQRLHDTTTKHESLPEHHSAFVAWAEGQGIQINGVGPAALSGRGIGLVATRAIKPGDILINVPPSAMLSPASHHSSSSFSPQAKLTATLLELSLASDNHYTECAKVWPTPASFRSSLAWFTPSDHNLAHKHLFPTALAAAYDRLLRDAETDAAALDCNVSDPAFLYHWAIANTRSFSFKPPSKREGIMVLCPVLDYMNHCSSGQGVSSPHLLQQASC